MTLSAWQADQEQKTAWMLLPAKRFMVALGHGYRQQEIQPRPQCSAPLDLLTPGPDAASAGHCAKSASVTRVPRSFRGQEGVRGPRSLPTRLHNSRQLQRLANGLSPPAF